MSLAALKNNILGYTSISAREPAAHLTSPDRNDIEKGDYDLEAHKLSTSDDSLADTLADVDLVAGPKRLHIDPRMLSDAIIGLSDGLTVPFALTAGLSAFGDTKVVIYGGLAELCAGAISMGLGGYLGAKSEECVHLLPL